jgi:hypothetical protein
MLAFEGEPPVGKAGDWVSVELRVVLIGSIQTSVLKAPAPSPQKHYGANAFKLAKPNQQS